MKAFLCANGLLTRCDAPRLNGSNTEIAHSLGFKPFDVQRGRAGRSQCIVCLPISDQEVYLTIHGQERSVYGLVVWEHEATSTLVFAATPFDLTISVEYLARYEKALYDFAHHARLRDSEPHEREV